MKNGVFSNSDLIEFFNREQIFPTVGQRVLDEISSTILITPFEEKTINLSLVVPTSLYYQFRDSPVNKN